MCDVGSRSQTDLSQNLLSSLHDLGPGQATLSKSQAFICEMSQLPCLSELPGPGNLRYLRRETGVRVASNS